MTPAQFIQSQYFPPGSDPGDVFVWVQQHNHDWVAEFTGLPLEDIKAKYEAANNQGLICTIKLHWNDIKEKHL